MKKNIHDTVSESLKGLLEAGLIEEVTMRELDALQQKPVHELTPRETRRLRKQGAKKD